LRSKRFNLLDNVHALDDLAEHNVLAVEPLRFSGANKKLGAVGIWTGVGHRKNSRSGVLQLEVLILELVAVDRLATSSVVVGEVTTLAHEVRDDAVEAGALEAESFLASAQSTEVLGSLWHYFGSQLHDNPANFRTVTGHVEENSRARSHGETVKMEGV